MSGSGSLDPGPQARAVTPLPLVCLSDPASRGLMVTAGASRPSWPHPFVPLRSDGGLPALDWRKILHLSLSSRDVLWAPAQRDYRVSGFLNL